MVLYLATVLSQSADQAGLPVVAAVVKVLSQVDFAAAVVAAAVTVEIQANKTRDIHCKSLLTIMSCNLTPSKTGYICKKIHPVFNILLCFYKNIRSKMFKNRFTNFTYSSNNHHYYSTNCNTIQIWS